MTQEDAPSSSSACQGSTCDCLLVTRPATVMPGVAIMWSPAAPVSRMSIPRAPWCPHWALLIAVLPGLCLHVRVAVQGGEAASLKSQLMSRRAGLECWWSVHRHGLARQLPGVRCASGDFQGQSLAAFGLCRYLADLISGSLNCYIVSSGVHITHLTGQ